jgi:hypothetical protein
MEANSHGKANKMHFCKFSLQMCQKQVKWQGVLSSRIQHWVVRSKSIDVLEEHDTPSRSNNKPSKTPAWSNQQQSSSSELPSKTLAEFQRTYGIVWMGITHLTSNFPVTAAHLVKDDGVRPADLVPSPCPWKGWRLVYVTGTGLAACTFCNSLFSWAAAGESGGSSCLRSSSDFRNRSNFRLDSARLACACK